MTISDPDAIAKLAGDLDFSALLFDQPKASTRSLRKHRAFRDLAGETKAGDFFWDINGASFPSWWLANAKTRFELVGVVNRLDRRDVRPGTCGETRLIYRLVRTGDDKKTRRLPLAYNVVFEQPDDNDGCRQVAKRWFADDVTELAGDNGPLTSTRLSRDLLIGIEFNVRSGEARPAGTVVNNLGVIRYDREHDRFRSDRMEFEPQPYKGRISRPKRRGEMLTPAVLAAAVRGTATLEERDRAWYVGFAAEGTKPAHLHPARTEGPFAANLPLEALAQLPGPDGGIDDPAALRHRLDGNSCTGCHRQRSIEGFHFPGAGGAQPLLRGVSPHLAAQQRWREAYVAAVANGTPVDDVRPLHNAGVGARGDHCSLEDSPDDSLQCQDELSCRPVDGFAFGVCLPAEAKAATPCDSDDATCIPPTRWFPGGFVAETCAEGPDCAPVPRLDDFRECRREPDPWGCARARATKLRLQTCSQTQGCRDGYACVDEGGAGVCLPTAGLAEFRLYGRRNG